MKVRRLVSVPVAMTVAVIVGCFAPVHTVAAQGFASVSSQSAKRDGAEPATAPGTMAEPAPSSPAATQSVPAGVVTQVAALGAASDGAGAAPNIAVAPATDSGKAGSSSAFDQADKVLVVKHERKLYLLHAGRTIGAYTIKLGLNPYGHKQQEGDFRTPEGRYELVRRNPRSDFFLSILVSYPNREDEAAAKENGWRPGGAIMIHGQPNVPRRSAEFYASRDWTDGCIALSNSDMVDVWLRTAVGMPIEIRP